MTTVGETTVVKCAVPRLRVRDPDDAPREAEVRLTLNADAAALSEAALTFTYYAPPTFRLRSTTPFGGPAIADGDGTSPSTRSSERTRPSRPGSVRTIMRRKATWPACGTITR